MGQIDNEFRLLSFVRIRRIPCFHKTGAASNGNHNGIILCVTLLERINSPICHSHSHSHTFKNEFLGSEHKTLNEFERSGPFQEESLFLADSQDK